MSEADWDKIFREKLKLIWKELNELVKSNLDKELIQKQLKSIANDFLHTFQKNNCPIPVETNNYSYENFYSVAIPLGSFSLFIPHFFLHFKSTKTYT